MTQLIMKDLIDELDILLDLGLPMYEAITQGTCDGSFISDDCDEYIIYEDDSVYQIMTPLDVLFNISEWCDIGKLIDLLIDKYNYDISKQCRFADGKLSSSFQSSLVQRICAT